MPALGPYKVLVVSYTFPPEGGIGGRRWAKFARSLAEKGCQVEVVAASINDDTKSLWSKDASATMVYRYTSKFPKPLRINPITILQKLSYRLALILAKIKTNGTPYDRALFDEKDFLRSFSDRMNVFKPHAVVVSGPPFNLMYYLAAVRDNYRNTRFFADFRDPWMGGVRYGYGLLNHSRRKFELYKEAMVIEKFDLTITPWKSIADDLISRYKAHSIKIQLLTHCWDMRDLGLPLDGVQEQETYLIYGGEVYPGFDGLLEQLQKLAKKYSRRVLIHTSTRVADLENNIHFSIQPAIAPQLFFERMRKSKYALFLIPNDTKNGFPTKLMEFAACGIPIVAVGYKGSLSEVIINRGLGIFVEVDNVESELEDVLNREIAISPDLEWIAAHELSHVTDELLLILEKTIQSE